MLRPSKENSIQFYSKERFKGGSNSTLDSFKDRSFDGLSEGLILLTVSKKKDLTICNKNILIDTRKS